MAGNNMNNLTTLIKRLEAATSRLEDIASSSPDPTASTNGTSAASTAANTTGSLDPQTSSTPTPRQLPEPLLPSIEGFDALMNGEVEAFVSRSEGLGGLIAEQSASVLRAFAAERKFLIVTTTAKRPDIQSPIYMEILKELQSTIGIVNDIRVANRGSPYFNHLTTVSEGIAMLGWVTIDPKPVDFVNETLSSAQFYGNRVLKEYKDKDHSHVEWVQGFYRIFKSLVEYIKNHYPSGITWNNKDGIDPQEALRQVQSGETRAMGAALSSSGPPAPPPPPMTNFDGAPPAPPMPTNGISSSRAPTSDMGAVFDQLSRGEAVTAGLRKVDPSQQTHKNPSLRAGAAVPPTRSDSQSSNGKSPIPSKRPKPESMRTKKPPRMELDGNKWIIENYDNPPERMLEIDAQISHSILISRCTKTAIRVLNKANAISIDSSSQVSLVIDSLVSSVDVIKTPRFEMQVLGTLPTIMLDQVDGASIYLSRESMKTEVFTSKCTAVNINLPGQTEDDDYKECPLPEQIKSVIRNGAVVSEIVEHAG
ncbi:hypothetical protein MMC34_002652 [Xylographa carneopallida]|nr:hypothetical protein [Xylographa carneopallida]